MAVLVELAGGEEAAPRGHHGAQLVQKGALSNPGSPRDQEGPPGQRGALEGLAQRREFPLAPHQARGGGEPEREVAAPQREGRFRLAFQRPGQPGQVVRHPLRALVAPVRLLLQEAHDHCREERGEGGVVPRGGERHPGQDVVDQLQRVTLLQGEAPGGQVVQGRPQGVQVGALLHGSSGAAGLFRRQVGEGAGDVAVVHEPRALLGEGGGQAEVDKERGRVGPDQDVGRRHVAVRHPPPVHLGQDAGEAEPQLDQGG